MKNLISIFTLTVLLLSLSSCANEASRCEHIWKAATCSTAKTCSLCGITEGEPSAPEWQEATCTTPKTCSVCEKTEGSVSTTHSFVDDKCELCGLIQLTLSNFEDYIDINASVKVGNSTYTSSYGYVYMSAKCSFEATGNTHYKYNNVHIAIKFSHYDKAGYGQYLLNNLTVLAGKPIETEAVPYDDAVYTVKLNVGGNGSQTCELSTPWSSEKYDYSKADTVFDRTTYEVISISGTIQEYK